MKFRPLRWIALLGILEIQTVSFAAESISSISFSNTSVAVDPPVSRAKRIADSLAVITTGSYYPTRFVTKQNSSLDPCLYSLCNLTAALPVKLTYFKGERIDDAHVRLDWETSEEVNSGGFVIERSLNPRLGFEIALSTKAAGTSSGNIRYQEIDPNDNSSYTYYRLKQVDLDDKFEYSRTIAIKGRYMGIEVTPFPNPGQSNKIAFRISGLSMAENLSVTISDSQGHTILRNKKYVVDPEQPIITTDLSALQQGSYVIEVSSKSNKVTGKFIITP
jgi:hypothetical protein